MIHPIVRSHTITRFTARLAVIVLFAALLSAVPFHGAFAQTAPNLGAAANFAVLAGSAVTCTDSTVVGDVGVSPGTAVTQTNCTIIGTVHPDDPAAIAANAAFFTAYDNLKNNYACTGTLDTVYTGATLTLAPGVYCNTAAVTFTDTKLVLDAGGNANAVWIFKIGTLGTGALTGTNLSVIMANGGQPCNVYWWVAEAATMTTTNFKGNLLAGAATTITGGSFIMGRDFAKAAVTLTNADIVSCTNIVPPPPPIEICKDFCKDYFHHDKHFCNEHDKEFCRDHREFCKDHDKNFCNGNDKDDDDKDHKDDKNHKDDKDHNGRR